MFLRIINFLFGLFGYKWVLDEYRYRDVEHDIEVDEGWEEITESSRRYKLVKKL